MTKKGAKELVMALEWSEKENTLIHVLNWAEKKPNKGEVNLL